MTPTESFLSARDFLLRHREDYATAYRDFRWPDLDRFNWALAWISTEPNLAKPEAFFG